MNIRALAVVAMIAVVAIPLAGSESVRDLAAYGWGRLRGQVSTAERVAQFGPEVERRLRGAFESVRLEYPPREIAYVSFKDIRRLEVYGRDTQAEPWTFVREYRVLGASGTLGPKLLNGDHQVPEGIYHVDSLNPNSRYHVAIRLDYPNAFDRAVARRDGRSNLGGDIMIHGARVSVGCLAMGNEAAEDLFVLAALTGLERVRIVISPTDFRDPTAHAPSHPASWVADLYAQLQAELGHYQRAAPVLP